MVQFRNKTQFGGRLVIVGFGCIGQGILPLLLRHIDLSPERISILTRDEDGRGIAGKYGVSFSIGPLTPANYNDMLVPRLDRGDFLLNLSVGASSIALIEWCQNRGVLYLDTCLEPWERTHLNPRLPAAEQSNYAFREAVLALRQRPHGTVTAVTAHGANPGLVAHFVKQALLALASDLGAELRADAPTSREEWAMLACSLGIKTIQVSEHDTQIDRQRKQAGEFVNTWSVDAFIGESCQMAELGWGTHERDFPESGSRHSFGCQSAIYLNRPGASTSVRTWTPLAGPSIGFLISHGESISISDYLTLGEGENPEYRPTVHFAYRPSNDAVHSLVELVERNLQPQLRKRVLNEGIVTGTDELGVLLTGHSRGGYWYGSRLTIEEARTLVPHNNATTLQVAAAALAGVIWAITNPDVGIVEAGDMNHEQILAIASQYLGEMVGEYTDWTPLDGRGQRFNETIDDTDPWQFQNFLLP